MLSAWFLNKFPPHTRHVLWEEFSPYISLIPTNDSLSVSVFSSALESLFLHLFNESFGFSTVFFISSSVISFSPKESFPPLISWFTCCESPDPCAPYEGWACCCPPPCALEVTSSVCCSLGQLSVFAYTWYSLLSPWSVSLPSLGIKALIFTFLLKICDLIIWLLSLLS